MDALLHSTKVCDHRLKLQGKAAEMNVPHSCPFCVRACVLTREFSCARVWVEARANFNTSRSYMLTFVLHSLYQRQHFGFFFVSASSSRKSHSLPGGGNYNPMKKQGAIILGVGGDNSRGGVGTFFEGAITSGYASDAADAAVHASIIAANYQVV